MDKESLLLSLKQDIAKARHIAFFGGAGVSTESGIPDFRSANGLYQEGYGDISPETILSHDYFYRHTGEFYDFYREKMLYLDAKPNPAHLYLAKLERERKRVSIITQNIDGLHQKAGSKEVYELHGSVHRNKCLSCGHMVDANYIKNYKGRIPLCPKCSGLLKPEVVLYGEPLPEDALYGAIEALMEADLLLVAGTSLSVYPAAGLLHYYKGEGKIYVLNLSPLPFDKTLKKRVVTIEGKLAESILELQRL